MVLLEDPRDLGNIGACVRVAAAADVGRRARTGEPRSVAPRRAARRAGLHFAVPGRAAGDGLGEIAGADRPLLALDPDGEPLDPAALHPRAVLAFGSERRGLSDELLARADARLRIPMRAGVSSLNLATSVAAVLFAWRPAARRGARLAPADGRAAASTPSSSSQLPRSAARARASIRSACSPRRPPSAISSLDQLARLARVLDVEALVQPEVLRAPAPPTL